MKLLVYVNGGTVQDIISDTGKIEVLIIDRDVEGQEEMQHIDGDMATVGYQVSEVNKDFVEKVFKESEEN